MLNSENGKKTLAIVVSFVLLMSTVLVFPLSVGAEAADGTISDTLVNGDMEAGSWYAWAGDTVLYDNDEGQLTGNDLNTAVWTQYSDGGWVYNGNSSIIFPSWTNAYPIINDTEYRTHEIIPGFKTVIKETKFSDMDLSDMAFSVWTKVDTEDAIGNQFFEFYVKYRSVNTDGSYGPEHKSNLLPSVTEGRKWLKAEVKLDDMTAECKNAETIEVELYLRSYCSILLDDADITANAYTTEISNTVINGDMEAGSWYAWAGDTVLYDNGEIKLTGNDLNQSALWTEYTEWVYSGKRSIIFPAWVDNIYPPTSDGYRETPQGFKSTLDTSKFSKMDLSAMQLSMMLCVGEPTIKAFDIKYRSVNTDGTYGETHVTSLIPAITKYGEWAKVTVELEDMTKDCENASTIEIELYAETECTVQLDDIDVTAARIKVAGDINNDGKANSQDLVKLRKYLLSDDNGEIRLTGNDLNQSDLWTNYPDWVYSGSRSIIFPTWVDNIYPPTSDGYRETPQGFKSTLDASKFAEMDLSTMKLSMMLCAGEPTIKAFDIKYRSVNTDGTYGETHVTSLIPAITEYGKWAKVTVELDDMTEDCENASTIEIELYAKTKCNLQLDDIDVTANAKADASEMSNTVVNGDMEAGSWYAWAGDTVLYKSDNTAYDISEDGSVDILDLIRLKHIIAN